MDSWAKGRVLALGTLLFLLAAHPTKAQQRTEWTWKDSSGNTHTRAELDSILKEHDLWVRSKHKSGHRGNLSGTDLEDADLHKVLLSNADLNHSRLTKVLLNNTDLSGADLTGASLVGANLTQAFLNDADLSGADLKEAELTDANLYSANLSGATFEPKALPEVRGIASAQNLELLRYEDNPDALSQLRKSFADGGFRNQERKITYALKRREAELSWEGCKSRKTGDRTRAILWSSDSNLANCGAFLLNRIFFDWTCQYGMSPGRPLNLGVMLWLMCAVLYFVCIHVPGKTGLYRVYAQDIEKDPSAHKRVEEILPLEMKATGARRIPEFLRREWLVLRASMFFSLMSAFNIGFRDINFGRWLRLLTREEFDIKARGWARAISGWQSLISVFLIALWVLTYFGRPFV